MDEKSGNDDLIHNEIPIQDENLIEDEISIKGNLLWDKIGIHRSIASFWYQFILLLIVAVPALLMYSFIMPNFILPFPTALGFQALTITYFGLFFTIMDVATAPACERYVAQYAEIDPKKALKYTQFFIWFQMSTGLIQITAVSLYCFFVVLNTDLNYAMWFFLIYSLTQYPGMLGAYKSTLKGYQRFDKSNIVEIIQGVLFENFTMIIFILLGRSFGRSNPAIGELMGATMGFLVGRYLDDFVALGLSAYFVKQIFQPFGISLKETIIPSFTLEEVKDSMYFGLKLLGAAIIPVFTDYITLMMMISWVPNYISIIAYVEIARSVASLVTTRYNFSALIAQSYNNDKKKLTSYAITRSISHWWYLAFFLTLEVTMIFPSALSILGGEWGKAAWIIPIYVFPRLMVIPPCMGADILQACNKPEYRTYGIIAEKVTKMLMVFLFLSPWGLVRWLGIGSILVLYVLHDIPAYLVITLVEFGLIHKKVVPVKVNWFQTFVAGTLCSIPVIPINIIMKSILDNLNAQNASLTIIISVIVFFLISMLFIFPMFMFFFYGFFGGWDDASLKEFDDAVEISGPSQGIMKIYYKFTNKGHQISPIKNRFSTPHKEAYIEINELMELKNELIK